MRAVVAKAIKDIARIIGPPYIVQSYTTRLKRLYKQKDHNVVRLVRLYMAGDITQHQIREFFRKGGV